MIEITNIWDQLCNICIVIMKALSRETGMSYGLINILLFVILGPISTICFMLTTAFQVWMKKQPLKKILTWIFAVIGLISVFIVLGLVAYGCLLLSSI
jgi:uncharacterized membrane protein